MANYKCGSCEKDLKFLYELLKHERIQHQKKVIENMISTRCPMCLCNKKSTAEFSSHLRKCKFFQENLKCTYKDCNQTFQNKVYLIKHMMKHVNQVGSSRKSRLPKLSPNSKFMLSRQAFKAFLQQYELFSESTFQDATDFFSYYKNDIIELLARIREKVGQIKV